MQKMYRDKYVSYAPTDCVCVFLYMLDSEEQNTHLILTNPRAFLRVKTWFKVKVMGLRVRIKGTCCLG